MIGCDETETLLLNNPADAVQLYRNLNEHLEGLTGTSIKDLSRNINQCIELKNKVAVLYENDTTLLQNPALADQIFQLADSVGKHVARLAVNSSRTMQDVVYLKLNTATSRDINIHSKEYKEVYLFFENLNSNKVFPTINSTVEAYYKLLNEQGNFKTVEDFLAFLEQEDTCFRSLLTYLNNVTPEDLQKITDLTASLFETITQNVQSKSDELSSKIYTYLVMRFNRRIIQNAMVCSEYIKNNVSLTNIQAQDFRWMVIQPFLTIDQDAMAYITDKQVKQLLKIADELPSLLLSIDGVNTTNEKGDLEQMLAKYFIDSYIKFLL